MQLSWQSEENVTRGVGPTQPNPKWQVRVESTRLPVGGSFDEGNGCGECGTIDYFVSAWINLVRVCPLLVGEASLDALLSATRQLLTQLRECGTLRGIVEIVVRLWFGGRKACRDLN